MNLAGVPDSIPAAKIRALFDEFGLPTEHLMAVSFGLTTVTLTLRALDLDGHAYFDRTTGEAALHQVTVPVIHAHPALAVHNRTSWQSVDAQAR